MENDYLPVSSRWKFYHQTSSIGGGGIYQYHIDRWNPYGNIAIETTERLPKDVNLVVGLIDYKRSEEKNPPKEISSNKIPSEVKKALINYVFNSFKKEYAEFRI